MHTLCALLDPWYLTLEGLTLCSVGACCSDSWNVWLPGDTGRVRLLLHGALPLQQVQRHGNDPTFVAAQVAVAVNGSARR